jgi:hypothetical protein
MELLFVFGFHAVFKKLDVTNFLITEVSVAYWILYATRRSLHSENLIDTS